MTVAVHALGRPVWNSLTGRQSDLTFGDIRAVRLAPDYGLFAAAADGSTESLTALAALVPAKGAVATVGIAEPAPGAGIEIAAHVIWQMVCEQLADDHVAPRGIGITPLNKDDAPQMFAIARPTQPGPFFERTHQLGEFVGVKDAAGKLLAMAGERMKPPSFTEVSGVCNDPDCRGVATLAP